LKSALAGEFRQLQINKKSLTRKSLSKTKAESAVYW
jgi:hypothetical protein